MIAVRRSPARSFAAARGREALERLDRLAARAV